MNKSLALKNKLSLFFSLICSFLVFFYLVYFLINGPRGIVSYNQIKNKQLEQEEFLDNLSKKNIYLIDKINRLKTNTIDLDFLDEQFRIKAGFLDDNEIIVLFEQ